MTVSAPTLARAYSVLQIKDLDTVQRRISGIATTPTPDRVEDIVESLGASFRNPIPLLLFHDSRRPVGTTMLHPPTAEGVTFEAHLPEVREVGLLRDRVEEAWQSITHGLIRGVSIGFRPLEDGIEFLKTGGIRFTKFEIVELSLVSVPANLDAQITTIKAIDARHLAALGPGDGASPPAGVPASTGRVVVTRQVARMKTLQDQITEFEATRQAKTARMDAILAGAGDKGESLEPTVKEEYDNLDKDLDEIDEHLTRLRKHQTRMAATATPVEPFATVKEAGQQRGGGSIIRVEPVKLPPGIGYARAVQCMVTNYLDRFQMRAAPNQTALDIAKQMYPSDERLHAHLSHQIRLPQIIQAMKAAVPAATTTNTTWASALVDPTNLPGEFIEYLRPRTIIGRLNLRRIPFNVRMIEQTQGGTGYWVGQGAPKPLTAFGFAAVTTVPTKVAGITVITEELARFSSPDAEMAVREALAACIIERIDIDLLDPAEAGTANVQPASLTNGLTALSSAGTDADAIRTDIMNLLENAIANNQSIRSIVLVMPETLALAASLMVNALGNPEFPGLTVEGGVMAGIRVVPSQYLANQSGRGNMVVAVNEAEVFLADDGQVSIDVSRETALQMLDNPTNNSATATATTMVSMWQTNSIALRAERFINWAKRRATAVAFMDDVNWGAIGSP